jgi:hypothetical protein
MEANDRIQQLPALSDLSSYATYAAAVQPIVMSLLHKLEALRPPSQDESAFGKILDELKAEIAKLPALRKAAESGNQQEASTIVNDLNGSPFNVDAADLGLSECAKNAQPGG